MFLSGTFPFSNVPEPNHQTQIEVVSCDDLFCAYIPGSNFVITPSLEMSFGNPATPELVVQ
jgi:hypothetical protein